MVFNLDHVMIQLSPLLYVLRGSSRWPRWNHSASFKSFHTSNLLFYHYWILLGQWFSKNTNNLSIYLKNNNVELSKRLFKSNNNRPLISAIKSEKQMIEFVSKHLFEREVFYNKASITIDCYKKDIYTICDLIISNLN